MEAFIDHLRSVTRPLAVSTARGYQVTLRLFCEYVTDARYGWPEVCCERFGYGAGADLPRVEHRGARHGVRGAPCRRPLTYDEVQALFDAADGRVEEIRARGRKGALAALRDAAMLKTVYAFGLRRREACGLDLADLRRNPQAPQFGRFGALFVRWGKASQGQPAEAAHRADGAGDGLDPGCWGTGRRGAAGVRPRIAAGAVGD